MSVREGPPPSLRLSPTGFSSHMHPPHGRVDQARGEKQKATKTKRRAVWVSEISPCRGGEVDGCYFSCPLE